MYPYFKSSPDIYYYPFDIVKSLLLSESQIGLHATDCPESTSPKLLSDRYNAALFLNDDNGVSVNLITLNCLLNEEAYRDKVSRILAVISYQREQFAMATYHALNSLQMYPYDRFLIELIGFSLQKLKLPLNTTFYNIITKLNYMHSYSHNSKFELSKLPDNDLNIYDQLISSRPIMYGEQFNRNFLQSYIIDSAFNDHYENVCQDGNTIQQEVYRLCKKFYNLDNFVPTMTVDWSQLPPVKLLCLSLPSLDGIDIYDIFEENCQGLSDALWLIDVPNEKVSFVALDDDSLYVMFYNFPSSTLLRLGYDVLPRFYILFNQEKNVLVESEQYPNIGFTFQCTADVSIDNFTYPAMYVDKSLLIWEYSQCNMPTWAEAGKKAFYMPQALRHHVLHETCERLHLTNLLDISDDIHSPIHDVLFYGTYYDYRQKFHEYSANSIKMKILSNTYTTIISKYHRDRNIETSKITLNLRSCQGIDGHLNSHRIRYLLGKAKLVITDKSGCDNDEKLYIDNNAIVIGDNYDNIIQLIQHFLTNKDDAHKYEMSGFTYILKDSIIDLFENDNDNEDTNICDNSKSFIIQLACSMEYTKELLLQKMNIYKDESLNNNNNNDSNNDKKRLLWKKRLHEKFIRKVNI